jgi:hypothetical protein
MSITYEISPDEQLIRAYASGIVHAEELQSFLDSLLADTAFTPGLRGLYDARFAEPDITILQLAEVAAKVTRLIARGLGRVAIVAQSVNTVRVSKTFAVLARAAGVDVDVFSDLPEAEGWLNEPPGSDNPDHNVLRS